jgi:hypothetical protein
MKPDSSAPMGAILSVLQDTSLDHAKFQLAKLARSNRCVISNAAMRRMQWTVSRIKKV